MIWAEISFLLRNKYLSVTEQPGIITLGMIRFFGIQHNERQKRNTDSHGIDEPQEINQPFIFYQFGFNQRQEVTGTFNLHFRRHVFFQSPKSQ